jgi:hypothetical protein
MVGALAIARVYGLRARRKRRRFVATVAAMHNLPETSTPGRRVSAILIVIGLWLAVAGTAAAASVPTVFRGGSVWIDALAPGATPATVAASVRAAGAGTVYIKAGDGSTADPQFTAALVSGLHALGVSVCGWTVIYGVDPTGEAAVAAASRGLGADCVVYDAEGPYDKLYGAAQEFLGALRASVGPSYPLGLATQPYVQEHPTFPYSVFLGPGGSNVVLPLMYWNELHASVDAVFAQTYAWNAIYGRPIVPVGQLFDTPTPAAIARFRQLAAAHGSAGPSFFDLDGADADGLGALVAPLRPARQAVAQPATVAPGADGDEVVWAQELLNAAGAHLPVGGYLGAQTAAAVGSFQRAHGLTPTGTLDSRTWVLLLRERPHEPSWLAAPPQSAR